MHIRYICSDQDQLTNITLEQVAERAASAGITLAGTVQPAGGPLHQKCRIVLGLLPAGDRRDVTMDLGPGATGCRLDTDALEAAVLEVHARLPGAQALIVNKFGKQEATGRGLVGVIGAAVERGLPVLVGVSPDWRAAFLAFAGAAAEPLPADPDAALAWLTQVCRQPVA